MPTMCSRWDNPAPDRHRGRLRAATGSPFRQTWYRTER